MTLKVTQRLKFKRQKSQATNGNLEFIWQELKLKSQVRMSVCNQNSETGGKKSELRRQKLKLTKSEAARVLGNDRNVGPQLMETL